MKNISERIIVPLDVASLSEAIELVKKIPEVTFWKVGLQLFISAGREILTFLKEQEKRIFLDLKFHDIPNTISNAIISASLYDVDFLTIHATAGREALKAAGEVVASLPKPPKLLAVTLLTSLNSRDLAFDLKIPLELSDYVLQMALLAKESGLDGVISSPWELEELRRVCDSNFLLVSPGIRPSWASSGDQKRVMTPIQAFSAGANYLVIGRPITAAANPQEAWAKICAELVEV